MSRLFLSFVLLSLTNADECQGDGCATQVNSMLQSSKKKAVSVEQTTQSGPATSLSQVDCAGLKITSADDCRTAVAALGFKIPMKKMIMPNGPAGCVHRLQTEKTYWNLASDDKDNADYARVCAPQGGSLLQADDMDDDLDLANPRPAMNRICTSLKRFGSKEDCKETIQKVWDAIVERSPQAYEKIKNDRCSQQADEEKCHNDFDKAEKFLEDVANAAKTWKGGSLLQADDDVEGGFACQNRRGCWVQLKGGYSTSGNGWTHKGGSCSDAAWSCYNCYLQISWKDRLNQKFCS